VTGLPSISIVITNRNYARFVGDAIASALAQTHAAVEVILVDDGSTDDSRVVIDRYRDRIRTIFKDHGGQGSAFNAGFECSSGDAVVFLDADDMLEPDTAERVATVFAKRPQLAKVHFRLAVVDEDGRRVEGIVPPAETPLPEGDLRDDLRRHPDDVPHPPSSGNAFARWALERVLPMPEEEFQLLADVYVLNLVAVLGPVAALAGTGGSYRRHGANNHYASRLRLDSVRGTVRATHAMHGYLKELAESEGLSGFPSAEDDDRSLVFLSQRLVSRRLAPELHPMPMDTRKRLALRGASRALQRKSLAPAMRILYAAWFPAVAVAPRPLAAWLAQQLLHPEQRQGLGRLVEALRGTTCHR